METGRILLIIFGGTVAVAAFWSAVVWFTGQVSGWAKLADVYPQRMAFNETCWSLQSARLRWFSNYNGILRICADGQALHLSVFPLFRPGHQPLSIPWEDVTVAKRPFGVELRFYRADNVPIRLSRSFAERLVPASDGRFVLTDV